MPTNLELLKSIHENGGEFEFSEQMMSHRHRMAVPIADKDWITEKSFCFSGTKIIYRIPSELEVSNQYMSILPLLYVVTKKIGRRRNGDYHVYFNVEDYNGETVINDSFQSPELKEINNFIFTAGLMLWDKLLKEKR